MAKQLNARIITKHDKEENWIKATSFIPKLGEIIVYEPDNLTSTSEVPRIKIGNGFDYISTLPFLTDPYVIKETGKSLSTNDYTNIDKQKVDKIPKEYEYKDYTYTAGADLGLDGMSFYNKGIIEIKALSDGVSFDVIRRTGPSSTDKDTITISTLNNNDIQNQISQFMLENLSNYITTGVTNGSIRVSNIDVPIKGLKELAYMTLEDIQNQIGSFIEGAEEVAILTEDNDNIYSSVKMWYDLRTESLNYRLPDQSTGFICPNMVTGVYRSSEDDGYLTIQTQTDSYDVEVGSNLTFSSGDTNGAFTVTKNDEPQTVYIYGLGSNAYTSTAYLPIEGGTITGDLTVNGTITGNQISVAVWNDYAEYRQSEEPIEPGYIVYSGDDGILHKTVGRLQFFEGVVSDTFGFAIGKTDKAQTPLAVAGRVLVYTDEELHAGNVVCAGPHGKVCKMTKQEIKDHPDRIVGIVSEIPSYETWGEENIPVNGRVWIRIK